MPAGTGQAEVTHWTALVQFLRARLRSNQEAREVAQEAYARLLQLDRPEELNFLRAYLFKIALNLVTDHMRRGVVSHDIELFDFSTPASQDDKVIAQQVLEIIGKAVAELPPKCRQAFTLSRMENWSSMRIGLHMGLSDRVVRIYIARALEHIQRRLHEAE